MSKHEFRKLSAPNVHHLQGYLGAQNDEEADVGPSAFSLSAFFVVETSIVAILA